MILATKLRLHGLSVTKIHVAAQVSPACFESETATLIDKSRVKIMHPRISLKRFPLFCLLFTLWAVPASAQTTSFTYQGRLQDAGTPANGNYDFQFALFDSLSGGGQVASTQTLSTVAVAEGMFTVQLDFGGNAFSGANRFLEIRVRPTGGDNFTTLAPRQQITSTPYAIRSANATAADTATTANSAAQATSAANLSGTPLLPNGTMATTQAQGDGSGKLATTAYVDLGLSTKQTWLGTSANLAAALSDETGTGAAVFGTAPTFTTKITAPILYGGTAPGATQTIAGSSNAAPVSSYVLINPQIVNGTSPGGLFVGAATSKTLDSSSVSDQLHLQGSNGKVTALVMDSYGSSSPKIISRTAGGTAASPAATAANTNLAVLAGRGYETTTPGFTEDIGLLTIKAAETITKTAKGTYMSFFTTPIGGTIPAERLRVSSTGDFLLGTTANPTANSGKVLVFGESGATNPTMGTNTAGLFARDVSGTTKMFAIDEAGNATQLNQDSAHRFVTDAEKATWNGKQNALGYMAENQANKSTNTSLGTSDVLYPTQKAVKTYVDAHSGGGSFTSPSYFQNLAALLEPDAIEPLQKGSFSYTIGPNETKYVTASFFTRIGSSGMMEVRDPREALPLRGVTLNGTAGGSSAIIVNPTIPTYANAWQTYYDRLQTITTLPTKTIAFTANNQTKMLLPGPYGSIILLAETYNAQWVGALMDGSYGINFSNELGDVAATDYQRNSNRLTLAVNRNVMNQVKLGTNYYGGSYTDPGGTGQLGSIVYVNLPSNWSAVPDPNIYTFRDDFMGSSLDTSTVWNRVQSTTGNVDIDTNFQWCEVQGNGSWGANGAHSQTTFARSAGKKFVIDVVSDVGQEENPPTTELSIIVGLSDGAGQSYTNFAHGVLFATGRVIKIYENGTDRGTVGLGWTKGATYRVRITPASGGSNATYEIQGGTYAKLGGDSWTNITPATSSSTTNIFAVGFSSLYGRHWVGDAKVF